jgi:DNA-binding response OmpR family regulator
MRAFLQAGPAARVDTRRRVLILDDHNFFAACLRTLLDNESDLVVCDIMANSIDLRSRIERLRPDLLVIDLSLGTESGLEVGQRLRSLGILTPILFVSSMSSPVQAQLAGISRAAFIAKSRSPAEFLAALRAILGRNDASEETATALGFARSAAAT